MYSTSDLDSTKKFPSPVNVGWRQNETKFLKCSMHTCPFRTVSHKYYNAHIENHHLCQGCNTYFSNLHKHKCTVPQSGGRMNISQENIDTSVFQEHERAHQGALRSYIHVFPENYSEMVTAFEEVNDAKVKLAKSVLHYLDNMKIQIRFMCKMSRKVYGHDDDNDEPEEIDQYVHFISPIVTVISEEDVQPAIEACVGNIIEQVEEFIHRGSGHRIKQVISDEIRFFEYKPFYNARANGGIDGKTVDQWFTARMPFYKKGIINFIIPNKRECFKYCVLAAMHYEELKKKIPEIPWDREKHPLGRPDMTRNKLRYYRTYVRFAHLYDWTGVEDNVQVYVENLERFEERNGICVNIYTHKGYNNIFLARKSKQKFDKVANLFLITDETNGSNRAHFVWIRDLTTFVGESYSRKNSTCPYCLTKIWAKKQNSKNLRNM